MKKYFVAIVAICLSGSAFAQNKFNVKDLSHQVHAGLAVSHIRDIDSDGKAGFTAGWKMEYQIPFVTGLYANAGIDLTQKGYRKSGYRASMFYADIPIHVGYSYDFNDSWSAYGEFGPYFGAGLGGKKRGYNADGDWGKVKVFAKEGMERKRFDWGMGLHLGTEYKKTYSAALGFDWGCYDISPRGTGGKNFTFSLTLGYRFGK